MQPARCRDASSSAAALGGGCAPRRATGFAFALLLLALAPLARADDASWAARLVGVYAGIAYNGGRYDPMRVSFRLEEGRLVGRYQVFEPGRTVEGTLTEFAPDDESTGLFRWTDLYGAGVVRLTFSAGYACFEGRWGKFVPLPGYAFDGCRPEATS